MKWNNLNEIIWRSGFEIAKLIRTREVKPSEVMEATLARCEKREPEINSFVSVLAEESMAAARKADKELLQQSASDLPELFGVPLSVKDLAPTAGIRTTFGSVDYADNVPKLDSISVGRLRKAGAIVFGKTTTPEFGMLGVTESRLTGVTNNPWNLRYTAGGSSGGAAASIAAGIGSLGWGSDGGGSIRIPAAYCGVVGLKASLGWVPGDHPWDTTVMEGPITRTVIDQALMLKVTSGHDPRAPLSTPFIPKRNFFDGIETADSDFGGIRVAFAPAPAGARVSAEVAELTRNAAESLSKAGAIVTEVSLDLPDPVEYFIDFWGPAFLDPDSPLPHAAMLKVQSAAKRVSLESYLQTANETRSRLTREFNNLFSSHDVLLTPTSPVAPFPHPGEHGGNTHIDGIQVSYPAIDFHRFTESPTHAGLPAITVPAGFSSEGLPIGIQFVSPLHTDIGLLRIAAKWEKLNPWAHYYPGFTK